VLVARFGFGDLSLLNIDFPCLTREMEENCKGINIPAMATPLTRRFVTVMRPTPGMLFSMAIF
jgi:hypothetical protein